MSVYTGVACSTLSVTTAVNNVTRSSDDDDDDDDDAIYCPMPFQPDSYSVCCLNGAGEMRCCQEDVVPSAHDLPYVYDNDSDKVNLYVDPLMCCTQTVPVSSSGVF